MSKLNPSIAAVQDYRAWLSYSEEDLTAARILVKEKILRSATYHAQQCVEKALKSYLVFNNKNFGKLMILLN